MMQQDSRLQSAHLATGIPRGQPAFAETQRAEILRMLREAGSAGVSREVLIFERHFTQCGARVDELKREGFVIVSEPREGEQYVRYVLKSEPLELYPLPDNRNRDWYTRATGHERPKQTGETNLPLFEGLPR